MKFCDMASVKIQFRYLFMLSYFVRDMGEIKSQTPIRFIGVLTESRLLQGSQKKHGILRRSVRLTVL